MQCSNCGTENSPKVKFCSECGSPVGIPCSQCSFRNARDAAVCGGCGASLGPAPTAIAERRQITVFFSDIVGSTSLAESLDPEDLRDLYARYQNLCAETVQRYEGHLAQYLGDGVLAYFGYPTAHEDDAARAVRSGLEILDRIKSIGGNPPQVRIGIHTGIVVVGDVGAGSRREQLALGEAPNIAARLQSEAVPDSIVISDATRRLLAGQFAVEDLGPRMLKGLSRPLHVFQVLGSSGASSRFHAMQSGQGLAAFVGREREVAAIRAAWADAAEGRGRTLLLRGPAGMGKSRLVEAAKQIASTQPHDVFQAQCSPYQMNSPFYPILEMLERRMGYGKETAVADKLDLIEKFVAVRSDGLEPAAALLAELLSVPTMGRYPELQIPPAKRHQWTIEVLTGLLLHPVAGSPVLLSIEDLHWADPSTVDLLAEMVARQASLPALLVCTARPEFIARGLDRSHCREILVEALSPDDVRALVAFIAGKQLPVAVREEVVARTGGIPLFVEAVTHTVMEAGILRELDDRYELTRPLPQGLIPPTVQDSLMARIDRLGADRPVAQLAATIGRESSFELLQAVLDQPVESLTRSLRHLVDLELVTETGVAPASTYTFKHALIQDAAYESLLRKTRQEFHSRIAEVLIHRFADLADAKPELLARHCEGAGRTMEAIAGWMKAGQQAQQRLALREAGAHMQRAVSLLQTLPEDDPDRLQFEMEAQLVRTGSLSITMGWGSHELESVFIRTRDLCRRLGNTAGLIEVSGRFVGMYFLRGNIRQAAEEAESMLEMALQTGNPIIEIVARHCAGYPAYFLADFPQARAEAEQAIRLYTPERERELAGAFNIPSSFACGSFLALSLWFMGYPEQAERARSVAWRTIEVLDIHACTAFALATTPLLHYARRDYDAIVADADRLAKLSSEGGYFYYGAVARIYQGWSHAMHGDVEAGIAEMKAGLESCRVTGTGLMTPQYCLMMAEAEQRAGRADQALSALSQGLAHIAEYHEHVHEPELHRFRAEILLGLGDSAGAETSLHRALEIAQAQQAKMLELRAALALAKLQRGQGRTTEACALLQPLEEWFQEGRDTPELVEARAILDSLGRLAQRA
ncbi:MAG TPA: adenylate/guanylate cyclase domain-containing protein [Candidatus Acidoferrum sp.]|nr:adenylate/guanylate cyclase domain-containing protein [Candidatus Acidoferrum sp.]